MDYSFFQHPAQTSQPFAFQPTNAFAPHSEPTPDALQDAFQDPNAFPFFDQNVAFNNSPFIAPPQSPPSSLHRNHSMTKPMGFDASPPAGSDMAPELEAGEQGLNKSSDDERENLTPAQSRRKAQNRAAQRAFRERKEQHVRNLEEKLKAIEAQSTDLLTDNERLRREVDRLATQNEILMATSQTGPKKSGSSEHHSRHGSGGPDDIDFSDVHRSNGRHSPHSFSAAFMRDHPVSTPEEPISHRIVVSPSTGERLLSKGAAWDLIQNHNSYKKGEIDAGQVMDRLKEKVVCDGAGHSFPESELLRAIDECEQIPGDELL